MLNITYKEFLGGLSVFLEGRRVGVIQAIKGGYCYIPNRGTPGEKFATVAQVKRSLEGEE